MSSLASGGGAWRAEDEWVARRDEVASTVEQEIRRELLRSGRFVWCGARRPRFSARPAPNRSRQRRPRVPLAKAPLRGDSPSRLAVMRSGQR